MNKHGLAYAAIAAALGYFTAGRAKKAKRTKAIMYGVAGFLAATQIAPRFGINLPRLTR